VLPAGRSLRSREKLYARAYVLWNSASATVRDLERSHAPVPAIKYLRARACQLALDLDLIARADPETYTGRLADALTATGRSFSRSSIPGKASDDPPDTIIADMWDSVARATTAAESSAERARGLSEAVPPAVRAEAYQDAADLHQQAAELADAFRRAAAMTRGGLAAWAGHGEQDPDARIPAEAAIFRALADGSRTASAGLHRHAQRIRALAPQKTADPAAAAA
jgi:hypothetical protein